VPIFDTTLVIISRLRRGVPISSGGRDHVSHRLVRLGLGVREAVATIYLVAALCGGAAIATLLLPSSTYVFALVALIGLLGLAGLVLLERVDLSDSGQVARSCRRLQATRLKMRNSGTIQHIGQEGT